MRLLIDSQGQVAISRPISGVFPFRDWLRYMAFLEKDRKLLEENGPASVHFACLIMMGTVMLTLFSTAISGPCGTASSARAGAVAAISVAPTANGRFHRPVL